MACRERSGGDRLFLRARGLSCGFVSRYGHRGYDIRDVLRSRIRHNDVRMVAGE